MAIEIKKKKAKMNKSIYLRMSMLDISKNLCISSGMITLNQSINRIMFKKKQNYATWILRPLLFISKPNIIMKTLQMILKNG